MVTTNPLVVMAAAMKIAEHISRKFDKWPRTCVPEAVIACICNALSESGVRLERVVSSEAGLFFRVDGSRYGFRENIYRVASAEIITQAESFLREWTGCDLDSVADQWCRGLPHITLMRNPTPQSSRKSTPEADDEDRLEEHGEESSENEEDGSSSGPPSVRRRNEECARRAEERRLARIARSFSDGAATNDPNGGRRQAWSKPTGPDPTAAALRAHRERENEEVGGLTTNESVAVFAEHINNGHDPLQRRRDLISRGLMRGRRPKTRTSTERIWYVTRLGIAYISRHFAE